MINSTLTTLYSLEGGAVSNNVIPVNFAFLQREFTRFATLGKTADEIRIVLNELCSSLEELSSARKVDEPAGQRASIVDPNVVSVKGRQTKCTSARVDRSAKPPKTTTVNNHQVNNLGRVHKPARVSRRRHVCPVCRKEGHHATTCRDVLMEEHSARADAFFKGLIAGNKTQHYVRAMASRVSVVFANEIEERMKRLEATDMHES